jgi:two-component sensor histidine kinase/PAS domain-containing protein
MSPIATDKTASEQYADDTACSYKPSPGDGHSKWLARSLHEPADPRIAAFDTLATPALLVDGPGRILACNLAASNLIGQSARSLVGSQRQKLLVPREATAQRPGTQPYTLQSTRGDSWPVLVRAVALSPDNEPPCTLLLLEAERAAPKGRGDNVSPSDSGADAPVPAPEENPLILDVAHDLRSPLHAFNMALSGLMGARDDLSESDHGRLVGALQRSSVHLQTLVENLLDAASLGASQFSLMLDAIDLATVVRESMLIVDPLLGPNGQRLTVTLPDEPLVVPGDAQRLRQVLVNLLHNAIKYGPKGGEIKIRARRKHMDITVKVTDQGPGIPEDEQSRIFERYYRGRSAGSMSHGNGLGLSIARAIIQAHGGTIGVKNEPKGGTSFWFTVRAKK